MLFVDSYFKNSAVKRSHSFYRFYATRNLFNGSFEADT